MRIVLAAASIAAALSSPAASSAEEIAYQAVMSVRDTSVRDVPGRENHVVGIAAFRGVAILSGGELAVHHYEGWFEQSQGDVEFHGRIEWAFDDGSILTGSYDGAAVANAAGGIDFEAAVRDLKGEGRYAGATGEGAFTGRRLDGVAEGGHTYLQGTLSVTLPE